MQLRFMPWITVHRWLVVLACMVLTVRSTLALQSLVAKNGDSFTVASPLDSSCEITIRKHAGEPPDLLFRYTSHDRQLATLFEGHWMPIGSVGQCTRTVGKLAALDRVEKDETTVYWTFTRLYGEQGVPFVIDCKQKGGDWKRLAIVSATSHSATNQHNVTKTTSRAAAESDIKPFYINRMGSGLKQYLFTIETYCAAVEQAEDNERKDLLQRALYALDYVTLVYPDSSVQLRSQIGLTKAAYLDELGKKREAALALLDVIRLPPSDSCFERIRHEHAASRQKARFQIRQYRSLLMPEELVEVDRD
jgi:hypothetical protein